MSGWVHIPSKAELLERERQYGISVNEWLSQNFPELCIAGSPHPAAFAAVTRLHGRYGKGCLTKQEHGDLIRRAVDRWREEYEL